MSYKGLGLKFVRELFDVLGGVCFVPTSRGGHSHMHRINS